MSVQDKVNILMVDDQPAKLLSYEVILAELGENLIKATSGREALEQLLKNDVAVVLMDVSMPELDGFELADMIRQHPRFQKTAIIFISAVHLTDLDRLKGYQRGAVDYISVPVVPEVAAREGQRVCRTAPQEPAAGGLNRELEQRVAERTEELEQKAASAAEAQSRTGAKESGTGCHRAHRSRHHFQPAGRWDARLHQRPVLRIHRRAAGIGERLRLAGLCASRRHGAKSGAVDAMRRRSGENYESEYRMRGKDGEYRWFRARAVPIRDHEGKIIKWYGTCSDIHDSKMLEQSIRDSAIELEKMVDERTAALRRLSGRLMTMQDEERRRIAREMHDGLGQELVAAKMMLDGILAKDHLSLQTKRLHDASELMDRAIQQMRSISHLLHPPLLDEVGLLSALRWYVEGSLGTQRHRNRAGSGSTRFPPAYA